MKVELRNIHKTFGKVHANDDISLVVPAGTIQGILGENGAGKSTLMKVLTGFIHLDKGEILLDDRPVKINSAALAQPIIRGRNQVPPDSGTTPRLTKAAASLADAPRMRMSQPRAVSMP